ncbi:30S ribosomal protein S1 (plasmid) [Calothrix brevissima NIES-22]|nr:30S ribosomal protein S1 [Calothrix brevissima NIES-22]
MANFNEKLAWERLHQMQAENVTVYSKVVAMNANDVLVEVEGLLGSIDISEFISDQPIQNLMAEELPLKFHEVDSDKKRLILSHKKALVVSKMKQLRVGEVVKGNIKEIKHFGVLIDIGDVIALLSIAEITHAHIDSPNEIFHVNDEVKAIIIDLDFERCRISLSTKQLV